MPPTLTQIVSGLHSAIKDSFTSVPLVKFTQSDVYKECVIRITWAGAKNPAIKIWSNHIATGDRRSVWEDIRAPGRTVILLNILHSTQQIVHSPVFNVTLQQFLMITFYWIWQRIETLFGKAGFWKERNFSSIHQNRGFSSIWDPPPVKSIYYVFRSSQNRIHTIRPT